MEIMIHVANVLYLLSYLMRDILWLRVFTVIAASCLIPYFYFRTDPLMPAIYWNLLFTSLNVYWICRLLVERRPVRLSGEEQRLYQLSFPSLTPHEMLKLLRLGRWVNHTASECFVDRGKPVTKLGVIFSGKACFEVEGKPVDELREGQFIGEMGFLTDRASAANVVALEPTRCVWWPKLKLKGFLKNNPDLRAAFQRILGADLTSRLQASWARQRGDATFS